MLGSLQSCAGSGTQPAVQHKTFVPDTRAKETSLFCLFVKGIFLNVSVAGAFFNMSIFLFSIC